MKYLNFKIKIIFVALLLLGSVSTTHNTNATILDSVDFAGRTWTVKSGNGGPGPNNWGNTDQDVFVDGSGLHLKVSQHEDDQKWYSSEVYLPTSLGYGKYTFDINSRVDLFEKYLVAAPFLYQDDTHEIDIEHSLWGGETDGKNLFYTVQPYDKSGNQQSIASVFSDGVFQDIIDWQPDKIIFSTKQNGNEISSFTYTSSTDGTTNNFNPGNELVHINFWQYKGATPNVTNSEFIINNFAFDPYVAPSVDPTTSTTSTTPDPTPTPTSTTSTALTVNLNIRYQNSFIFSGPVVLTTNTVINYNQGNTTSTTSTTVLTALINASQSTTTFSISDLQLSDYGYYLNCLYIQNITTSTCGNWNYVVENSHPGIGMGSYPLTGGENIYLYFGDSWKITTPSNTVYTNTSTPFYTWQYNYSDLINDWVLDPNDLVAITIPNPNPTNLWDTDITVSTTMSNEQGLAYYNFTSTGTYSAKITADDYSKWSNSITLTVTNTPAQTSTTSTTSTSSGGGSTPLTNVLVSGSKIDDSVTKLINFIKSKQGADGKIDSSGTSDWVAMSFGAKNIYATDIKNSSSSLHDYLYNYDINLLKSTDTGGTEQNDCAAYPRHILGLLASGVPKTDNKINALKTKLDSCVQNNNFGQNGINDDIFGLIAAIAIGEDQNSQVVKITLAAIKANQQPDGAFAYPGFPSADITGAAISALKYAQDNGATVDSSVYTKAKQYLTTQQLPDGGWCYDKAWCNNTSDSLSTSWVVIGINSLNEGQSQWFNSNGKNPWHILTTLDNDHFTQSWDGGIDWFGTKSAVPALLGKSWPIILDPKPVATGSSGSSEIILIPTSTPTTTMATTTFATTTPTTTVVISTPSSTVPTTATETPETKPIILTSKPTVKIVSVSPIANNDSNNLFGNTSPAEQKEELNSAEKIEEKTSPIDNLPLDTPTRRTAKKVLAVTGGSAAALGLYLGLRLVKNVI